jgi:hypothetical protein
VTRQPSSIRTDRSGRSSVRVDVSFDRSTRVTTGRAQSLVDTSIAELARTLDPVMWHCSPFFPETFKAVRGDNGYAPDGEAPIPGLGWRGLLFEHFRWRMGPFEVCRFVNILNIDFQVMKDGVDLRYSLHRAITGRAWFSPRPLGVDVDSGYLTARETGAGIDIDLVKKVRVVELGPHARPQAHTGVFSAFLNQCLPVSLKFWLRLATVPWSSRLPADASDYRTAA